ncbi:glutathione S-transferase family protein [Thiomonas sp.]|jgi:glutathione S-transferase|uniref:glutathione S-transferase family protein n=1 Tax=Thiomonas sp. TaxID=2047785 RepID=UPI0026192B98|nr:glutathione S-transferase family protein [Thiomonas sp.]
MTQDSSLRLFDLAGADEQRRFSPYCWRIRLALAHKGLPVRTIAWRFTDKQAIAATGQGKVPVLVDGERWIHDSWAIAEYLEDSYTDTPSLFGPGAGRALARFLNQWAAETLQPAIARVVVPDIPSILHPKDQDYFRSSREAALGLSFEALAAQRPQALDNVRRLLAPLRSTLGAQPYLAGARPLYADHAVFGAFQWARTASPVALLEPGDPVEAWVERMLDAYGGLARSAAPVAQGTEGAAS